MVNLMGLMLLTNYTNNIKKLTVIIITMLAFTAAKADQFQYKYWLQFTDKDNSAYSILKPEAFMSPKAMARRAKYQISIDITDLPVNQHYIEDIKKYGATIISQSKWENGIIIGFLDTSKIAIIKSLTRVKHLVYLAKTKIQNLVGRGAMETISPFSNSEESLNPITHLKSKKKAKNMAMQYGFGYRQLNMLQLQQLHQKGYRGAGINIAVFDAGFYQVPNIKCFDSARKHNNIKFTWDLIDKETDVFDDDDHGTEVLSTMAANLPGTMIGTAPDANYFLFRTEDAATEYLLEEANWLIAAEFADSLGIDIISSSLGYNEFDDASMNHSYAELDGKTTLATRAANHAYNKGIFVVNSAGNEGDASWLHIGSPADAMGCIAIGSVDAWEKLSDFSSRGFGKNVKPDLVAMGTHAYVVSSHGVFVEADGTSYSAPIFSGALACLLQFAPTAKPSTLRYYLEQTSNRVNNPDSLYGYGIPNFNAAMQLVDISEKKDVEATILGTIPDTMFNVISIPVFSRNGTHFTVSVKNLANKEVLYQEKSVLISTFSGPSALQWIKPQKIKSGKYKLIIKSKGKKWEKSIYFVA